MQTEKRKWKLRLVQFAVLSALFLFVLAGIFAYLVFTRFHFSTQTTWPLAQLQWDHQTVVEFDGDPPQIIGHRGSGLSSSGGDLIIGNTHTAISKGIGAGVDWIEIDIRASSDDHLVVFHDRNINKKTNGTGAVAETSLADLKAVEVNVEPPESIPTLDEIFRDFRSENVKWILDIKTRGIHDLVLKWVDDKIALGKLSGDQMIIFGTYDVLKDYKDAGYSLGYTAIWGNAENRSRILFRQSQIIDSCRSLNCDYLVLPVIFASSSLIGTAKSNGIDVWVYGIDDKRDFNYLAKRGVNGFIVDHPQKITIVGDQDVAESDNNAVGGSR